MSANVTRFYKARLVDRIGNTGAWTTWTSGTSIADAQQVLDLLNDQLTESQLDQSLRDQIDKIDTFDQRIIDAEQSVAVMEDQVSGIMDSQQNIVDEQQVLSEKIDGVYVRVEEKWAGSQEDWAGDQTTYAGVYTIETARILGDMAQAERTDAVIAQMAANDAIYQEQITAATTQASAAVTATSNLQTTVGQNTAKIQQQQQSIDGVYAEQFMKLDVNGHVAGHGSANNGSVATMVFNYDAVYFGAPSSVSGVADRPLMALMATPLTLPNGTVIPRGLYVENANIGYVHASKIYADSLSAISANLGSITVGSANIADGAITNAKIGDLAVDTLKIANNAVTVQTVFNLNSWQGYTASALVYYTGWWSGLNTVEYKNDAIYSTAHLGQISLGSYAGTVLVTLTIGHVYAAGASPWFFLQRVSTGEITQFKLYSNSGSNFICIRKAYENVAANEAFRFFLGTGTTQQNTLITLGAVSFTLEGAKK